MRLTLTCAAAALALIGASGARAGTVYSSPTGVNVNGMIVGPFSTASVPGVSETATFNPTPSGGGGVVIDELGQPFGNANWHDSQLEVEPDGTVRASVWSYSSTIVLGVANFGADNTASFTYNPITEELSGSLNGAPVAPVFFGFRQTPGANGNPLYYGFGTADGTSLGNGQAFEGTIDNVVISAPTGTPEPQSWALMLAGVGLAGALLRRRARRLAA